MSATSSRREIYLPSGYGIRNFMERFPARNTSEHKALKEHLFEFYARYSEDPLFIPSYLMDTAFAQLLQKQYHIYTSARDLVDLPESTVSKTNNIWKPVCGRNSNGKYDEQTTTKAEQGKKDRYAPSHSQYEALKKFVLDNPSTIALIKQDFRLPTGWWREVKNKNLDISLNGLEIYCRGNGKDDTEIGTVRGNRAIKRQCGIYYFEIEVLSKSIDNDIAIGFSKQAYNFDRFPGWEPDSWGYHGEDGKLYAGQGLGISYGPKWGSGDIIGCGVDYRNKSLFYTKNGRYLGKAFQKIKNVDLYPIVGMRTAERIEANFGHKPFKFDIKEYVANGKTELLHKIMYPESSTTVFTADIKSSFDFKNMTDEIVMEYLSHSGYDETARLLGRLINTKQEVDQISKHKEICRLIVAGNTDKAMQLFTKFYPNVLQDNPLLLLKLRCRKFLDMVQKAQSDAIQGTSTNYDEYQTDNLRISAKEKNTGEKRGLREDGIPSGRTKKKQKVTKDSAKRTGHLNDALAYGICLRQEYEDKMAVDPIVYSELMTSFSALAYTDLSNPAVAHLYSPQYTERIASEVYSAILVSLGENPTSSLERLYRQTRLVMEESVITGNGKAALINLDQDCLR